MLVSALALLHSKAKGRKFQMSVLGLALSHLYQLELKCPMWGSGLAFEIPIAKELGQGSPMLASELLSNYSLLGCLLNFHPSLLGMK